MNKSKSLEDQIKGVIYKYLNDLVEIIKFTEDIFKTVLRSNFYFYHKDLSPLKILNLQTILAAKNQKLIFRGIRD